MELTCPKCNATIEPHNINISSDLAKCESCNSIHKASELVDQKEVNKIDNPPNGTKISIKKWGDGSIELFYPKQGFKSSMIFPLTFSIIWISFIGFWTFMALKGDLLFALFSIPFWVIGFTMLIGLINSISETQTLILSKSVLTYKKDRPIRSSNFVASVNDIESIKLKNFKVTNPFSVFGNFKMMSKMQRSFGTGGLEMPAILTGAKTTYFFEDASDAEQEWVTATLDHIIKQHKNSL